MNYVENNNAGIVGGSHNVVNNFFHVGQMFFSGTGDGGGGGSGLNEGAKHLLTLELVGDYLDEVTQKLDEALKYNHTYPLRIQITDLVTACVNGVYYNGGVRDEDVEWQINGLFTLACLPLGIEYQARIVQVGLNYFFEMYPQK